MRHTIARFDELEHAAVVAALASAVCFALTQAFAVAPLATGDEQAHIDYAYQLWHGSLPLFADGLVLQPGGNTPPVQWTAQHPPLFYALLAPIVGPLADAGLLHAAVYAARAVTVLLFAALVVAANWSARQVLGPTSRLPLVVVLVVALGAQGGRLGGSAYNDMLAALLLTVLVGLVASSVRRGLDARLVTALAGVSALAALTRTSTMILAVVCVGVAVVAALLRAQREARPPRAAVALLVAAPAAVLGAAGWFYARNLRLTGSVTGGQPEWAGENLGRVRRTIGEVVVDPAVWGRLLDVYGWDGAIPGPVAAALLLVVPAVAGAVVGVRALGGGGSPLRDHVPGELHPVDRRLLAALLAGIVGVALAVQCFYVTTGGSAHPRYLVPVLVPLAIIVAAGLTAVGPRSASAAPRPVPWALVTWCTVVVVDFAVWTVVTARPGATAAPFPPQPGAAVVTAVVGVLCASAAIALTVVSLRTKGAIPVAVEIVAPR